MFRATKNKALVMSVIAIICILLSWSGVLKGISNGIKNAFATHPVESCYTDIQDDIVNTISYFRINDVDGFDSYFSLSKEINDITIQENIAITTATNKNFNKFNKHILAGYYSVAFLVKNDLLENIAHSYNSVYYNAAIIDFDRILNGFMNDKTWADIGFHDVGDKKITIKSLHPQSSEIYGELVRAQILASLTHKQELTDELFAEYENEINSVLEKMETCQSDDFTVYICSEQSPMMIQKTNHDNLYAASSERIAAIPIYASWNNEAFNNLPRVVTEIYFPIFNKLGFRHAENERYSQANNRKVFIDSITMAIPMKYVYELPS